MNDSTRDPHLDAERAEASRTGQAPGDSETVQEWLDLQLDGILPEELAPQLEQVLLGNETLQREAQALRALHALLARARVPVRAGFAEQVMAALRAPKPLVLRPLPWAAALLAALAGSATLLVSLSGVNGSLGATVAAMLDFFAASALAGAGLLAASWAELGALVRSALAGSVASLLAFGGLVVGLDLLLISLLWRGRRPADQRVRRE